MEKKNEICLVNLQTIIFFPRIYLFTKIKTKHKKKRTHNYVKEWAKYDPYNTMFYIKMRVGCKKIKKPECCVLFLNIEHI